MPRVEELFDLHPARASGFSSHRRGNVAYVTNGFRDNGVIGFVRPNPKDRVFEFLGIVVSAFCEATIQIPPFIGRGNGGSGLLVLEPRTPMTTEQLGYVAAYINTMVRWRFSWSRVVTAERIRRLEIRVSESHVFDVKHLLPVRANGGIQTGRTTYKLFKLDSLFSLEAGEYHNTSALSAGDIPLVSCADADNGIVATVRVPKGKQHDHKLTVAFNGMNTLTTKYHPYRFAAKDDVAVCTPKSPLETSTLVFISLMMGRERWRYSYYRKCFLDKLRRQSVLLPAKHGAVDEHAIEAILSATTYWNALKARLG